MAFIWRNSPRIACVLFILYVFMAAVDFAITLWRTNQCPIADDISELPASYQKAINFARSDNPAEVAIAAELFYEDRLVADSDTEIGFRNLCLSEDLRRQAARMGDELSKQWLVDYYGRYNFPMAGNQRYENPCESAMWRKYRPGDDLPEKGFSLTRYFYANSCDIPHLWSGSDRIVLKAAINCINKSRT